MIAKEYGKYKLVCGGNYNDWGNEISKDGIRFSRELI